MPDSRKCPPGCDCWRHTTAGRTKIARPCPPGCTCDRHNRPSLPLDEVRKRSRDRRNTYHEANRDRENEASRRYREAHREEINEQQRRNSTVRQLKYKHGMTPEDHAAMWAAQQGLCYLCGEPLREG